MHGWVGAGTTVLAAIYLYRFAFVGWIPQDEGTIPPQAPTSPGSEIEQGKIELSKEALEKVSGGRSPSSKVVVVE